MTDAELKNIEERNKTAKAGDWSPILGPGQLMVEESLGDVPVLVAEVRLLRAFVAKNASTSEHPHCLGCGWHTSPHAIDCELVALLGYSPRLDNDPEPRP